MKTGEMILLLKEQLSKDLVEAVNSFQEEDVLKVRDTLESMEKFVIPMYFERNADTKNISRLITNDNYLSIMNDIAYNVKMINKLESVFPTVAITSGIITITIYAKPGDIHHIHKVSAMINSVIVYPRYTFE